MAVAVMVSAKAQKGIDALPILMKVRVLAKLSDLTAYPNVTGIKSLKGEWLAHYRVRVGDFRVIFTISTGKILVVAVDDRKESY